MKKRTNHDTRKSNIQEREVIYNKFFTLSCSKLRPPPRAQLQFNQEYEVHAHMVPPMELVTKEW